MELNKIRFMGFDVNGSSLKIYDDTESGKYRVMFNEHSVTMDSNEDGNWIHIDITPEVTGYSSDTAEGSDPVFEVSVSLTLSFECGFKEEISQDKYKDYAWFFENFVYICTKISVENILKNTVLETIDVPWSSKL